MTPELAWPIPHTDPGDILLEAAHRHRRAGDLTEALDCLTEALRLGGEDRAFARVAIADILTELARPADAAHHLAQLRADPWSAPCELVAETCTAQADHAGALSWYSLAIANLPTWDLAELATADAPLSYANSLLTARHRTRRHLALPHDDWDNCAIFD
ncbi:hypothetical protein [Actinokineospora inagensis]|uniref:hypothetical protein n=1 Tax=Actinokineospora inagensis TaxID=103730 RepID=UPI00047DDBE7|nr:hypothetical protein [Actinokineospora inagensis]